MCLCCCGGEHPTQLLLISCGIQHTVKPAKDTWELEERWSCWEGNKCELSFLPVSLLLTISAWATCSASLLDQIHQPSVISQSAVRIWNFSISLIFPRLLRHTHAYTHIKACPSHLCFLLTCEKASDCAPKQNKKTKNIFWSWEKTGRLPAAALDSTCTQLWSSFTELSWDWQWCRMQKCCRI